MESVVTNDMKYSHLQAYYKDKRVFLTGHTGFKGSWMLCWLNLLGAKVKGYALAPENAEDHFNIIEGSDLCESVIADIQDNARLEKELLDFQPDFIFHLAAQPLVRVSYQNPSKSFSINAIGTAYILDAVRQLKKPCTVIVITTDKVYDNKEWHYPYRESDRLGGYDPYSASKACAELIISSYRNSFFNKAGYAIHRKSIASARAGNVIGGGDWAKDRIVPDIIRALSKSESVVLRNPNAVRPWQHVLDPIGGYLHLGTKMVDDPVKYADAWNFGPYAEDVLTVGELVEIAIIAWGKGEYLTPPLINQPHEAGVLKLDISKTVSELDWQPQYNSRKAIEKTLEWYQVFCEKGYLNTDEQLQEFIKCNS
jgi:CDP-glucose 4,6-dehydratase